MDLTLERCDAHGRHCEHSTWARRSTSSTRAHTDSPDVTPAQHANRLRLRAAMERGGFKRHYTWANEPTPHMIYDVPVK